MQSDLMKENPEKKDNFFLPNSTPNNTNVFKEFTVNNIIKALVNKNTYFSFELN